MIKLFQRLRRWYLRKFRGFVEAPQQHGSRGTSWQEHRFRGALSMYMMCRCHWVYCFCEKDYFIRHRQHVDNCQALLEDSGAIACNCPITDARYVKICPQCGLGHWMDATPKGTK